MTTGSPYFDSSQMNIDDSRRGLLKSVAVGGEAGAKEFKAAQDSIAADRAAALVRAAGRSALFGAGSNSETFTGAYDSRSGQLRTNEAGFHAGLAQTQASGEAYMSKASAAIPVLQAINANKISQL